MRKSQKTEQAGRQRKIGLEDQRQTGARSIATDEGEMMSGTQFQALVLARNNLNLAYQRVVRNKGAAGIDGMTVDELKPYLKVHREELLAKLANGTYKPAPVKRVSIPKPNGGTRKLGIPTVIDRLVQQAVAQVLSPKYEQIFSNNSFGFRPQRSAHDAIQQVIKLDNAGYRYVVDLDLKAYFDTVNHDMLMKFLEQRINDRWLLRLIRRFLTSGTMNGPLFERSDQGTPQGGPISPLLANIYLNEFDQELTRRGHEFIRYADDCNIFVKSPRAGQRVLASVTRFLEHELKLTLNQEKTQIVSTSKMKFLGFTLGHTREGAYPYPVRPVKQRVRQALKRLTKRNRGVAVNQMFAEIRLKMRGWLQYYGLGKPKSFVAQLDQWLRSRIRQYYWKQWKKIKTRTNNLKALGLTKSRAVASANTCKGYWRTAHSKTLNYTLTNEELERRGLINLSQTLQQIQTKSA